MGGTSGQGISKSQNPKARRSLVYLQKRKESVTNSC